MKNWLHPRRLEVSMEAKSFEDVVVENIPSYRHSLSIEQY